MKLIGLLFFGAAAGLVYLGINSLSGAFCSANSGGVILSGVLFGLGIAACVALGALIFTGFDAFEKIWGCAVGVLLVAACVGAMFFFGSRNASQACPSLDITGALKEACRGEGNPQAGAAGVAQIGGYHVVVLSTQGDISKEARRAPAAWKPATLADTDLALCIAEPREVYLDTCDYSGGSDVKRYRQVISARLVSAQTGEQVASKSFACQPRQCLPWELGFTYKLSCKVKVGQVFDWYEKAVAELPAVALSEPQELLPTPTPVQPTATRTAAATPTSRPSATPHPTAVVEASSVRLRSHPNTTSATLAGLRQGQQVIVLGVNTAGDWVKVKLDDGMEGWMLAELLSLSVPVETLPVVDE